MADVNITNRRARRKNPENPEVIETWDSSHNQNADSQLTELELSPEERKKERQKREVKNNILLDRARRQAENRLAQQGKNKEAQTGIVAQLLQAQKESKLLLANCFEQTTVLDLIDQSCVDRETISDMAVAIDAASTVYGYRVDRTHLDAQETSVNFLKNIVENSPVKNSDKSSDSDSPAKKNKTKDAETDIQKRIDELVNNAEDLDATEVEEEEPTGEVEVEARPSELFDDASTFDDLKNHLTALKEERVEKALKIKWKNRILEEDDEKISMVTSETTANDYYQQAISRHGDQNANSLLLNNTRCQGDGRLLHMHIRAKPDTIPFPPSVADFAKGVYANASNAFSKDFVAPENQFLPSNDSPDKSLLSSDKVEGSECDGEDLEEILSEANETELMDATSMPDRTIMETTMMPNQTILMRKRKKSSKVIKMRGRDLAELWLEPGAGVPTVKDVDFQCMNNIANLRTEGLPKKTSMLTWEELEMDSDDVRTELQYFQSAGFDGDFRDIESAYNAVLVTKNVTENEAKEAAKEIDESGGTKEEIYAKKKRLLLPGSYLFFMDMDDKPSNIAADPWVEECNIAANFETFQDSVCMDEFDSFDAECPDDNEATIVEQDNTLVVEEETTIPRELPSDDYVDSLLDTETTSAYSEQPVSLDTPSEEYPDVPSEVAPCENNLLLKHLGKRDAAHWKATDKVTEKEKKPRKEKVQVEQNFESYFVLSDLNDREEAFNRFTIAKPNSLVKSEDIVFQNKKQLERRPYLGAFDFENFTRPGLLFQGRYGGVRFQRSLPVQINDAKINEGLPENLEVEEAQDVEDVCRDWLAMFGAFRIINEDSSSDEGDGDSSKDLFSDYWEEGDPPANDDGSRISSSNIVADDDMNDVPTADDDFFPLNGEIVPTSTPLLGDRNTEHERLRDLWAMQYDDDSADSDEDESETVTIMEKKVTITNSNIDQSRVKAYMREILTCPWMSADKLERKTGDDSDANITITETSAPTDEQDDETSEIVNAVFAPPQEGHQDILKKVGTSFGGDTAEQMTSGVVLSDFNVEGLHSMSSLAAILPNRVVKKAERNMHVAFAFSIALQMCNENMLHLSQTRPDGERTGHTESWMGDFIVRNGTPPPGMGGE
ncbi:unnamed protein product [Auanema sp. JU1783]|nr:unnamed protein product [Auanema sp. JU1783]